MAWPQIGRDLLAVRVAKSEQAILAVMCYNEADTDIWNIASRVDTTSMTRDDNYWDQELQSSVHPDWADTPMCLVNMAGCYAIGAGSNVKKRNKAVRVALAVTLQIFERAEMVEELQKVVVQAKLALALVGRNPPAAGPPAAGPREAAVILNASSPPTHVMSPAAAVNGHMDFCKPVMSPASARPAGKLDTSAPRECLEDPYTELRVWIEAYDGEPAVLWPYCTYCNCWTDTSHHNGKKHQKALENYDPGQSKPTSYEPPVPPAPPAPPSVDQHKETPPPMHVEVIVEGNYSSGLAGCPGALQSAWMWPVGMQQGLSWPPQTMQVPPMGPVVQEGYPWFSYADLAPQAGQISQAPQPPHQVAAGTQSTERPWTHAINNVPWEVPQQGGTFPDFRRSEAPPWASCATLPEQEQEDTEAVNLPNCRWSTAPVPTRPTRDDTHNHPNPPANHPGTTATVNPQIDAQSYGHAAEKEPTERTATIGGCIEV